MHSAISQNIDLVLVTVQNVVIVVVLVYTVACVQVPTVKQI